MTVPSSSVSAATAPYALLGANHAKRGRNLFRTGLGLLILALVYLAYTAQVSDILHLYQGLVIFTLSFIPGLLWARSGGSRFPVFEPLMLLCANAYAVPLLNGHRQLAQYAPEVITKAGWVVILYQASAIATYFLTRGRPGRSRFWIEEILGPSVERYVVYGLVLSSLHAAITSFTTWIPVEMHSVLRAVFFGIGILCTFISAQRWGRGQLTASDKTVIACTLVPQLIMQAIGLLLIDSLSLLGIALLGYLSGGKRIPWVTILVAFSLLAILHNGKGEMRKKYWEQQHPTPGITDLPAFFGEWIEYGLQPPTGAAGRDGEVSVSHKLLERTSLMHILCLIVNYSPDRQPFLYGETYAYVPPQLIPRLFWPEKPRSHVATYRLAIYYGLQDEEATNATTIAVGMLSEAYANFGLIGAILLGAGWGCGLRKLQLLSWQSPMFSFAGLLMILLTAWSFNSELTMAAWISSLYQAIIVVLGVPLILRSLFGS